MKKSILFSALIGALFVLLSEITSLSDQNSLQTTKLKQFLILNINNHEDQKIYQTLKSTNYICKDTSDTQKECKLKKSVRLGHLKATNIYSQEFSQNSLSLRTEPSGTAHLEILNKYNDTVHRYSFSSVDSFTNFTKKNKGYWAEIYQSHFEPKPNKML